MKRWVGKVFLIAAILIANFLILRSIFVALPAHAEVAPAPTKAETIKDWVFSVNNLDTGFTIIDPETGQVHGPFLEGQLGNTNGNFDGAVTPDGKIALITNLSDRTVYFVDISDPLSPSVIVSVTIPIYAEDIDISSDGKFAMVTGYIDDNIAIIDILSHTLVYSNDITLNGAASVAIAPDNTAITGNYFGGKISSSLLLPTGEITHTIFYTCYDSLAAKFRPINLDIAPDGQTVIVLGANINDVNIYRITAPGVLTFTGMITGLPTGMQSVTFNKAGDKAYVISSDDTNPDKLSVLDILAPGQVQLNAAGAVVLPSNTQYGYFGVDVLAVYGDYLFAGNPATLGAVNILTRVGLTNFITTPLTTGNYPAATDIIYTQRPLTVQRTGTGTGAVQSNSPSLDCSTVCSASFNYNTVITLTAAADPSSTFTGWSGDCSGTGACVLQLSETKAYSVSAQFMEDQTLSVQKTGSGSGVVQSLPAGINCGSTCSAIYRYNTPVTLTAAADPWMLFTGWSGACSGAETECTLQMTDALTAAARFIPNHHYLPFTFKLGEANSNTNR